MSEGDFIKTLVVVSHPDISNSQTESFLKKGSEQVDVIWHHVESLKGIDVDFERKLLASCQRIVFQFPLYWYSALAGLKDWIDKVFSRNYVYGDGQYHLADKEFGLVVTTGLAKKDFQIGGIESMTMDQLMAPYRAFAARAHMKILPLFLVDQFWYKTEHQQQQLLIDYQRYLNQDFPDSLVNRQAWFKERLEEFVAGLGESDKHVGGLILDTFVQQMDELDQLGDTLKMIKDGEDDGLE
ncbi:NAD(P)H-dependent oxidoreductase [Companilactobacillus furfuricola]|uniref:NAD(P)H-dependent oxidoreductase n=1 Tax=Companilactobacillus furfuricola TaxID=1462575 RepID=UPI001FEB4DA1|nr:NAD(P)H-dependent oxidoreductase [Companilactobacillus furfuricola]